MMTKHTRSGRTRSIREWIEEALTMAAVGLLVSIAYAVWVGFVVLSTGNLA
jgi:hypothetical protein